MLDVDETQADGSYCMALFEQTKVLKRVAVAPTTVTGSSQIKQERQRDGSLHGATRSKRSK